jgi:hypothetical protein
MYSKLAGKCDGCIDHDYQITHPGQQPPFWMQRPSLMSCAPCEIELCQECHDTKHKLHCSEPPEMHKTKWFYYEPLERKT